MQSFGLSDAELFPLLDEAGREMLRRLREHPHAPRYNWLTGERLSAAGLARVREFAAEISTERNSGSAGDPPAWVAEFVRTCRSEVPFYRGRLPESDDFSAFPLTRREDLRNQPWAFVPDSQSIEDLIVYTTSGTTGTRLLIPATPELPARYLPLFQHALRRVGAALQGGPRVSIVHVCAQQGTVQLCSISSYLGGAGFAKINLDPADWNHPEDAIRFLEDCDPELLTGDPFALWRLATGPVQIQPSAIISAGTALSPGLRLLLARRFGCPILDVYSSNECGPIAFAKANGPHELFPHRIYLEILDGAGNPCPPGQRGQIVITGGLNPALSLIRYATGDFAALQHSENSVPELIDFAGRTPVIFRTADGNPFSSVDVSTALASLPLPFVRVHQHRDGSVIFSSPADPETLSRATDLLKTLFGSGTKIITDPPLAGVLDGKPIEYSSELPRFFE